MDPDGFSQVGRYGTLSLMKRHEPDTVVTSFGIDTEELTFGRDPKCSVRLYYTDVDLVHCRITFEERKAFLVVLGSTGLSVDDCKVYPNKTAGGQPTTIPLSNSSEIEIHNKRFRFSYPPKEIRATLFATPAPPNRRLRLSMINSAQVFSPRPSQDPRENLRILQSPVKNTFRSPVKPSALSRSPILPSQTADDGIEEQESIVLVDGNHPRVVEEDKDLVILENIEVPLPQPVFHIQQPKTPPHRRPQSLHRAVLIRSAQRAVLEHEERRLQEEEEMEELEVVETVAGLEVDSDNEDVNRQEAHQQPSSDEDTDDEEQADEEANQGPQKPLWRKSLEGLWPFRSSAEPETVEKEIAEREEQEASEEEAKDEAYEAQDQPEALPFLPKATPIRRPLGSFMTPQVVQSKSSQFDRGHSLEPSRGRLGGGPPVRYSLGGEARRVPLESVWRVQDIVLPPKGEKEDSSGPLVAGQPSASATPRRANNLGLPQPSPSRSRSDVTAEERKAIQERRRSALRDVDSYFAGGIPGMSPSKAAVSPAKPEFHDVHNPFRPMSPTKRAEHVSPVKDIMRRLSTDEEDEKLDTRSLLERMKETVEGMKKRRSTLGLSGASPIKPSIVSDVSKQISRSPHPAIFSDAQGDEEEENDENVMDVNEPFSLLRADTGSIASVRAQRTRMQVLDVKSQEPAAPIRNNTSVPNIIIEDGAADEEPQLHDQFIELTKVAQPEPDETQLKAPTRRSRTRSRSPQPPADPVQAIAPRTRRIAAEPKDSNGSTEGNDAIEPKRPTRKTTKVDQEPAVAPVPAPARRPRKATVEPEESKNVRRSHKTEESTYPEEPAPVVKRATKRATVKEEKEKVVAPQPVHQPQPAEAEQTKVDAKPLIKRTRGGAKVAPIEVDNGDGSDPLDAFNGPEEAADNIPVPAPTKAAAKPRKPRAVVKQEENVDVLKATAARTSRGTTSVPAATTKTPAPTKGRTRKTPATAPAAVPVEVDKENAPGTRTTKGSSGKGSVDDVDEGVVVTIKTRRTRAVIAKQEEEEETVAQRPARGRVMRSSRSRTKTS